VAVTAVDAEFGCMVPVTERNWLAACYVDFGEIGRPVDGIDRVAQGRQNEHRAIYAESRKGVGAAMKYLSHPGLSESLNRTTNRKPTTPQPPMSSLTRSAPTRRRPECGGNFGIVKQQLLLGALKEMIGILQERAKAGVEIRIIGRLEKGNGLSAAQLAGIRLHTRSRRIRNSASE
jgi:hypothetical protein